jgi:diguanylate cyclase (GGDEF)-like protein
LDRDLARRLYALVEEHDLANLMLQGALADLAQSHGDTVYAELIFLLTRLRLEPAEAARHWPGILRRQALISTATGHATDIRVAVLSYNLDVDRQLTRPKVVEMTWAEWTASTALLDEVTGLPNQRFLRAQLTREVERALRGPMPLSLIVLDADDFKRVNDLLGHDTGTAALEGLGKRLREHARHTDLVVRYGGDEFVVLLPATPKDEARRVAERLRAAAESYRIDPGGGVAPLMLTVSLGLATCPGDARDDTALFVAADQALYEAKRAGKNRVCLFAESMRSYARRRAVWPARIEPAGAPAFVVETSEVGEGGFSFRSAQDLATGLLIETALTPPEGAPLRMVGRVVWSRTDALAHHEVAVRFVEAGGRDRQRLSRWITSAS